LLLGVLALAGFAACGDDNPVGDGEDLGEIGGIPTKHTDPAALLAAHAQAISEKNLAAYEAMLMPAGDGLDSFRYCPKPEDVNDLPWMQGGCWGYETEIGIMTNMFDPNYASPDAEALQTIDMNIWVGPIDELGDGTIVVTTGENIMLAVGPSEGLYGCTRLIFTLVSYEGCLRIQRIEEIDWPPGPLFDIQFTSWANIKARYRP
jgi:hypothetical protein